MNDKMNHYTVVIVSLNGEKALPLCLNALYRTRWDSFDVILVDNGSTDRTSEIVQTRWDRVKIIRSDRNLGFAGGNNLGIKAAKGEWIVLLNDDTEVDPGWLEALDRASRDHPAAGILGCKLLYPGGKIIQHAGGILEPNGLTRHFGYGEEDQGQYDRIRECDYVTGAAFAVSRKALEQTGLLDARFFPIYFEEIDYCERAKNKGFQVLYIPDAVVIHHESRTTDRYSPGFLYKYHKNRLRFLIKNRSFPGLARALWYEAGWLLKNKPRDVFLPLLKSWLYILPRIPFLLLRRLTRH